MVQTQLGYDRPQVELNGGAGWRATLDDMLGLGLRALADKALFWVVTLGALGLWTFCAVRPELWRLATVGAYTLGVFLPMLLKGR